MKADGTFIRLGGLEVPTGGFSARPGLPILNSERLYVFFTTDQRKRGIQDQMGRSVLARLDDESQNLFSYRYDVSCLPGVDCRNQNGSPKATAGKFINVAPVIVNNADISGLTSAPGFPPSGGQGVLLWGSGVYRQSDVYLAYLPLNAVEDERMWRYAVLDQGNLRWSQNEADATALFHQPCDDMNGQKSPCRVGELSVAWNQYLRKWIMLYNHGNPRGINYRLGDNPWGPWTQPEVLFDPGCDRGYRHFMHLPPDDNLTFDFVYDDMFGAFRIDGPGDVAGEYGPYIIPRFTKGDATSTTIYYTMSTWNPYQVMLMKTTLQLTDPRRPY